jgi:hypothetical protein
VYGVHIAAVGGVFDVQAAHVQYRGQARLRSLGFRYSS